MLQIKNIYKQYQTGSLIQKALDGVSLNLREYCLSAIWDRAAPVKRRLLNIVSVPDRYDQEFDLSGISGIKNTAEIKFNIEIIPSVLCFKAII